MQRTSSVASNSSVSTNIPQFTSNLSPLIKLERLVFRLNSILAVDLNSIKDEVERKKHLRLLFEVKMSWNQTNQLCRLMFHNCETISLMLIGPLKSTFINSIFSIKQKFTN
jgi:hypothetical protein